jgi:hypothetical protein
MKQEGRNLAREDRTATLHELGQVIGFLIAMDQLPLTTLASLESKDSRCDEKGLEFWTEADRDCLREAEIEHLTNVILGRSQKSN